MPLRISMQLAPLVIGSDERKSDATRTNQGDDQAEQGEMTDDDADHTDRMHSAVESAADALLQRLRTRARVAKPAQELSQDNQSSRDDSSTQMAASPFPSSSSALAGETAVSHQPLAGPFDRTALFRVSTSCAQWRTALMAQASARSNPGEQLDLPDFMDDEWSEASVGHQEDAASDDDDTSDGEIVPSPRLQQHSHTGTRNAFDDSEAEQQVDADDGQGDDDPGSAAESERMGTSSFEASLSNKDVNVSKAIALKNSMMRNLVRLGFNEDLSRAALDAGVREIEEYDSDCELAYVDIFITLVKLVCDTHHDIVSPQHTPPPPDLLSPLDDQSPRGHFKWPVFDMAQFEFGNARAGTCFDSVCVLINLPKVAMDRTEELMEVLSSCLFEMIGDPIQVLIPSVSATGRTKGHAFLEFDDPDMARQCAAAVDGLTWGRGPYGRIRAKLFRQYQVKSPVPPVPSSNREMDYNSTVSEMTLQRRPRPRGYTPRRLDSSVSSITQDQMRESRELSREDLSMSDMSNGSWNSNSRASVDLDDSHPQWGLFRRGARGFEGSDDLQRSLDSSAMQLGDLRLSSEDEDDDEDDDGSVTASDMDLDAGMHRQESMADALARSRRIQLLQQSLPPLPMDPPPTGPRWRPQTPRLGADATPSGIDIEGPWKAYCEELIARNREMQEQVSYARRRIAALGHNNQKLHLLIDRMERDRDGLLFENDLLQTQLHGYEDHERQQEALMQELAALRRRMRRRDQRIERGLLDNGLNMGPGGGGGVAVELEGGVMSLDDLEEQLVHNIVSSRRLDDLKEWEQMLEGSLVRVRAIKEEIAMELQKKLAQQAEDGGIQDHKLCVVCLSKEKSILCLPCRHLCLCQDCSQHAELDKCPICRLVVENMLLVYA